MNHLTLLLALNLHFTVAVLRLPLARRGPETVSRPTNSIEFKDVVHQSSRTRVKIDYTLENPKVLTDNGALRRGNRVKLQNFGNVQYIGSVGFGNPPQYVDMAFDTGSSDTWIPGIHCASCSPHHRFDVSKSTTFFDTREKFYDEVGAYFQLTLYFFLSYLVRHFSDFAFSCACLVVLLSMAAAPCPARWG